MNNKILAVAGAAALALTLSASASYAGFIQPGETMGVSLDSPLPEGVFAADLEDYGKADGSPTRVGVNIPVLLWSTPWTWNNTRLEFLAAVPFAHLDGGGASRVGAITYALGPILAHDFGNGLTGGISGFVRTPDPSSGAVGGTFLGHNVAAADFRESLQYVAATGPFSGVTFNENGYYTTDFDNPADPYINNLVGGDFSISKTFDKITVGFTGFGDTDLQNRRLSGGKAAHVELGGLVGYDFGKFTLTGIVTRSVLETVNGVNAPGNYETRGWVRLIVPLYVAPAPAAVVARY
jgi:hypothetical protein